MAKRATRATGDGGSRCTHCKQVVPHGETARTYTPPDGYADMPVGVGFVICGEDCPELPPGSDVFYRPLGYAWARGGRR